MTKKPLVKKSKGLYMLLVCIGVAFMSAGVLAEVYGLDNRFIGFGAGLGSAAVGLGSLGLILLRRKPKDVRQQQINENDERFVKIREKSAQSTWNVTMLALLIAEVVFLALDYMVPMAIVIGIMAIHAGSYFVFLYLNSKKM